VSYRVSLETLGPASLPATIELSQTVYPGQDPSDPVHMRWKLLENPQGPSLAWHLWEGDTLVGRVCYQVREFYAGKRRLRAGFVVDLLIHPAHRGLETFLLLMRRLREVPGFDFLYLTPNAASAPLYASALKLRVAHRLSVVGFPVRSGALLESLLGRRGRALSGIADATLRAGIRAWGALCARQPRDFEVGEEAPSDAELDALAARFAAAGGLEGRRDASFQRWRFHASPRNRYQVAYLRRSNRLAGWIATRSADYLGYATLFVIDVRTDATLAARELRFVKRWLLERALAEERDLVLGIFMREHPRLARFCTFPLLTLPVRLLPQPVDLHVIDLKGGAPADPRELALTLADLDVF